MILRFCSFFFPVIFFFLGFYASLPTEAVSDHFALYSSHQGYLLESVLLSFLKQAKERIAVASFGITPTQVFDFLEKTTVAKTLYLDKKDLCQAIPTIYRQTQGIMHEKWATIDKTWVLLGSANCTKGSLLSHDNSFLLLYSPTLAALLEDPSFTSITTSSYTFFRIPHDQTRALHRLISLLDSAKKRVYVAAYQLTHPLIITALIEAQKRGVECCIVTEKTQKKINQKALDQCKKHSIPIYTRPGKGLFHHKWMVIDDDLVYGSANFTRNGFHKNNECIVFMKDYNKIFLNEFVFIRNHSNKDK